MKRPPISQLLTWLGLGLVVLGALLVATYCRPRPPEPLPPTVTPTATFPAPPTLAPPTVGAPTTTPGPSPYPPGFTPKPTWRPPIATRTPRPTIPPTPTIEPTDTLEPTPTRTPTPLRGRVPVRPGDTLWQIACHNYPEYLADGGCTCWPGLYYASPHIRRPQLILPGWTVNVPVRCMRLP